MTGRPVSDGACVHQCVVDIRPCRIVWMKTERTCYVMVGQRQSYIIDCDINDRSDAIGLAIGLTH